MHGTCKTKLQYGCGANIALFMHVRSHSRLCHCAALKRQALLPRLKLSILVWYDCWTKCL